MRILTFDIEDWFHILDHDQTRAEADWERYPSRVEANVERILEMLERHNQKATFFVLGWIARRHPGVVRMIGDRGHQFGTHSDTHQLVYEQSRQEFADDLRRSIDVLEQTCGRKIRFYRAPGFSIVAGCEWAFEALVRAGIEVDCSVFPAKRTHGGLPDWRIDGPAVLDTPAGPLKLLPMSVWRVLDQSVVFSGGGYFRLLPAVLLDRLFARQPYVMTYFHPRDFDPGQPVLAGLPMSRRFKSYVGLAGAMGKLERLVGSLDFMDIAAAEAGIDWSAVPRIDPVGSAQLHPTR